MQKNFLISLLFIFCWMTATVYSQTDKPIHEIEKEIHQRHFGSHLFDYKSDTNINVVYYKLDLKIDVNPNLLMGAVTVDALSRVVNLNSLFYDFSNNMTVDSIIKSDEMLTFTHIQNKIIIPLDSAFDINDRISLKIFYHGVPVPTGFGSFIFGTHNGVEPAVWTLSEPFGSSDWFPCKNTPADKADSSDVWLRCADELTAVSNGTLKEIVNNNDGTSTHKWHSSYPIANYLISLAVSNYSQYNFYFKYSQSDSMPVVNYIYPENLSAVIPMLDKTKYMLGLFSQRYGLYPFIKEKYGHAEFGRLAGMENQTISSMGVFNENIIAHELTHQWFGDKITCRNWENIWLNEGFATYGEAIYNEAVYGKTAYDDFIRSRMADAKNAVGSIYVQDASSVEQIFNGSRTYAKGCVVLHMLRSITGDSVYFNIIRDYVSDTSIAYKTAVTEDFQRAAEKIYGGSLNYFFNQWIFGENYPVYNADWETELISEDRYEVAITLDQDVNTSPRFFTMPLQIKIDTRSGDTLMTVFNNRQIQRFEFVVNSKPLSFKIDPDNLILKSVRENVVVPVSFELLQNYPNPFNPSTTIAYQLGKPANVKITIYDILGKEILLLDKGIQREGSYSVEFNTADLSSGIYFYKLEARDFENIDLLFEDTRRMVFVK